MGRPSCQRILLLAATALIPACGGGGGGGGSAFIPPSRPLAMVFTPIGDQGATVPIDFTLTDAESSPVTIVVTVSNDGGATFSPATAGSGNGSPSGLDSSPAGTLHTFLWNSLEDSAGLGPVDTQVQIRILPSDGLGGTSGTTANFSVDNTANRVVGVATATFPWSLAAMGNSETALGSLVADAFRSQYGVQLALQNGWGLRAPLPSGFLPANMALRRPSPGYVAGPPFDLVQGDLDLVMPFGNRVVTRTVTGSQLWAILEHGVSVYSGNHNGFPHISGFSFSFSASSPAGSRILSVTLAGGGAIANDATVYTFATNNFINAGGDGYGMLSDGQGVTQELMTQAVADYLRAVGPVSPTVPGRMTVVP